MVSALRWIQLCGYSYSPHPSTAAVPNLFGAGDWFHGGWFFRRLGELGFGMTWVFTHRSPPAVQPGSWQAGGWGPLIYCMQPFRATKSKPVHPTRVWLSGRFSTLVGFLPVDLNLTPKACKFRRWLCISGEIRDSASTCFAPVTIPGSTLRGISSRKLGKIAFPAMLESCCKSWECWVMIRQRSDVMMLVCT